MHTCSAELGHILFGCQAWGRGGGGCIVLMSTALSMCSALGSVFCQWALYYVSVHCFVLMGTALSMCSALGSVFCQWALYCVNIHCFVLMGTDDHCFAVVGVFQWALLCQIPGVKQLAITSHDINTSSQKLHSFTLVHLFFSSSELKMMLASMTRSFGTLL